MSNYRNDEFEQMAIKFKALSNPTRLKLFKELTQCCDPGSTCEIEKCVGELAKLVDIAPSTLSHHIKTLNQAGLIEVQRTGKNIFCRVDMKVLGALSDYFKNLPFKENI